MLLVKTINEQIKQFPYTLANLRRDNPQTSFPKDKEITNDILSIYDVYPVKPTPVPDMDNKTHSKIQDAQLLDGEWIQVWQLVELPLDQSAENIRAYREQLLQESDWVVAKSYESGESIPIEWTSYRQALRDITTQDGFPYSIIWPTKPT